MPSPALVTKTSSKSRGNKRRMVGRVGYLAGVVTVWLYVIGFPPWTAATYLPSYDDPQVYQQTGSLPILDSEIESPLWEPPDVSGEFAEAVVRWPWQSPSAIAHVELSTYGIAWRIAVGMVLLGMLLQLWSGVVVRGKRDRFVDMAWATSIGIAISIMALTVLGVFTAGYGLTDRIVVGGLAGGGVLGGIFGAVTYRENRTKRSLWTLSQLAWFSLGLVVALGFFVGVTALVELLMGGSSAINEWGLGGAMRNSIWVHRASAVMLVICGFFVSWFTARLQMPRGMAWGIFLGTVLLGLLSSFSY